MGVGLPRLCSSGESIITQLRSVCLLSSRAQAGHILFRAIIESLQTETKVPKNELVLGTTMPLTHSVDESKPQDPPRAQANKQTKQIPCI